MIAPPPLLNASNNEGRKRIIYEESIYRKPYDQPRGFYVCRGNGDHSMKELPARPKDRQRFLAERRNLKMAQSAHTYVRGSTSKFYEWLKSIAGSKLPSGPPIWICGDCHVSNLGPVAGADGRVEIEIRDLDQAVIGNPAHDLLRLGLSLATASRSSDLPGVTTARMLEELIDGYQRGLLHPSRRAQKQARSITIERVLEKSLKRNWTMLARERIEDASPNIPLGKCFWPLSKTEKRQLDQLFQTEDVRKLITSLRQRDDDDRIRVADAAFWVKGCSSLGRLRYAVIVKVGKKKEGMEHFCLIDIKEAAKADAPHAAGKAMPRNDAVRIVKGACSLSPFLGERMLAARVCGRPVIIRELRPQDLKIEIAKLTSDEAVATARFLAEVLGRAHGRQMNPRERRTWLYRLKRNRSKNLNAPSWLWTSVVDLIALHEKAYLDHCRNYALQA